MKTKRSPRPRRGIVLIVVLMMMVLFGILAGLFASSMQVAAKLARNQSWDTEVEWLGRSGIELAKWVLSLSSQGGQQYDGLNQKWAGGTADTNEALANIDLKNYELGEGRIAVEIIDHERKFTINTADEVILRQAVSFIGIDGTDAGQVVNGIMDWRDPDNHTRMGSDSETDYYETLDPPYQAKNGPIDDLSELPLIKGITPQMVFGTGSGGGPRTGPHGLSRHRRRNEEEPGYLSSFDKLFTAISSGQVNVNTVDETVLQLIPDIDENIARAIITARNGPNGAAGDDDDTPFRSVGELSRVPGIPPAAMGLLSRYFNVRSSTFEVRVRAQIGTYQRTYIGVVRRNGNQLVTLFMYWR